MRSELLALTGLRAYAALWVVVHHHRVFLEGRYEGAWLGVLDRGYLGVDLFFSLSGFVLAYNYGGRIRTAADYARFVALRLARLYPLHLVTLLAFLGIAASSGVTGVLVRTPESYVIDHHLVLHLLMIHAWGLESGLRYNQVSWSISAELFAYLLFPWLFAGVARFRRPALALAAALVTSGATVLALRALGHRTLHVPLDHGLVRVTGLFLAGCLAHQAWAALGRRRLPAGASDAALVGLGVLALTPAAEPWLGVLSPAVVFVLAAGSGRVLWAFTNAPVLYLGRISYSIYMTHMLVLAALQRVLPSWELGTLGLARDLGVVLAHAVAIVGAAAVSYRVIEWPARNALRERIGPLAGNP